MSKSTLIILCGVLLISAVLAFTLLSGTNTTQSPNSDQVLAPTPSKPAETDTARVASSTTLADQWQWQATSDDGEQDNTDPIALPFTPQSVHDALRAVKVDASGNLVLDHDAMIALDEALERIYNQLDANAMAELQTIIKDALPDELGQQTAELVDDYAQFLKAKEDFALMHEGNAPDVPTLSSIDADKALYQELRDLRSVYLGNDTASRLFRQSDASAEFMFESMRLELDTSLSNEEREARRVQLQQELNQTMENTEE